eukprot:gene6294-8668_t
MCSSTTAKIKTETLLSNRSLKINNQNEKQNKFITSTNTVHNSKLSIICMRQNEYFLIRFPQIDINMDIMAFPIVNTDTINELGFDPKFIKCYPSISELIKNELNNKNIYFTNQSIPSLKYENNSPDEKMRVKISKALTIIPNNFVVDLTFMNNCFNPAMIRWDSFILVAWRSSESNSFLKFGTLDWKKKNSIQNLSDMKLNQSFFADVHQEDPRMILLNDKTLLISYTGHIEKRENMQYMCLASLVENNFDSHLNGLDHKIELNHIQFHNNIWLKYPNNQKNWIPFYYNNTILFFQSFNPIHLIEIQHVDENSVATMATVYKGEEKSLPWDYEYGQHIRGGTPLLKLPKSNVYLSFFHTQSRFQAPYNILTYFTGAMTICDQFPPVINTITINPVIPQEEMYKGKWSKKNMDYVIYPQGIFLDDDEDYVWVSIGHQDKDCWAVKMNIQVLLSTMDFVEACK